MRCFVRCFWSVLPHLVCGCAFLVAIGLYLALYGSPADYRQGEVVRIMYMHVPSAWISLGSYSLISVLSIVSLVKKNTDLPLFARAIAPVGACFTVVCLITGSTWGKYTWGTWWVWDARLTSMLLLLFLYAGYISLWNIFDDRFRASKVTSLFAAFSMINVPVVKFSVDMWSTLHQPASVLRKGGVAIDNSMLIPLFTMFLAFASLFVILTLVRVVTLAKVYEIRDRMSSFCQEAL